MIIIKHRVNKIKELKKTSKNYGVEIDLRSNSKNIILNHDPYLNGEKFSEWIKVFKHKLIVLNVKEEGLYAAQNGTEFYSLFVGLSFFIIVAGLILSVLLFLFSLDQRNIQIGTLNALGLTLDISPVIHSIEPFTRLVTKAS